MSDEKNLIDSMKDLSEAIERSEVNIQFGLNQQGHIETIERILNKWNDFTEDSEYKTNMMYSIHVWDEIGKEIGWHPLSAALKYFEYLSENGR